MLIEVLLTPPATFKRPSVNYQSLLTLIAAVTGCHVPTVFSHISTSPIFCKGGQSKIPLTLTEAPFQDSEIVFFFFLVFRTADSSAAAAGVQHQGQLQVLLVGAEPSCPSAKTETNSHTLIYGHIERC